MILNKDILEEGKNSIWVGKTGFIVNKGKTKGKTGFIVNKGASAVGNWLMFSSCLGAIMGKCLNV